MPKFFNVKTYVGLLRPVLAGFSLAVLAFGLSACAGSHTTEVAQLASQDEVVVAYENLVAWTDAYSSGDYRQQWILTDPRIRQWRSPDQWREIMNKAKSKDGALLLWKVTRGTPVDADQLPCTEMKHCYRSGVQYILFVVESEYGNAAPAQPEFAVMAKSKEGWKFGGGSFLNRPMGETMVILTKADEARYKPNVSAIIESYQ